MIASPPAAAEKYLVITADDFGLHAAVNEAVEQASRHGVLTAASLMVAAPAASDAVRRAKNLPDLRVGLHLVLCDGWASSPRAELEGWLDSSGRFRRGMMHTAARIGASPRARMQLEAEIRAQFQMFKCTRLPLDHVNVHKHFHLHPMILDAVIRVGRDYGMRAMRVPAEPVWALAGSPVSARIGATFLAALAARMRKRLHRAGVACNDFVFGTANSGGMSEHALIEIIRRLPPGVSEVYLHPATVSGGAIARSMANYRHEDELHALLSPRTAAALDAARVVRIAYANIAEVSPLLAQP